LLLLALPWAIATQDTRALPVCRTSSKTARVHRPACTRALLCVVSHPLPLLRVQGRGGGGGGVCVCVCGGGVQSRCKFVAAAACASRGAFRCVSVVVGRGALPARRPGLEARVCGRTCMHCILYCVCLAHEAYLDVTQAGLLMTWHCDAALCVLKVGRRCVAVARAVTGASLARAHELFPGRLSLGV
jgi:hypothetical protein